MEELFEPALLTIDSSFLIRHKLISSSFFDEQLVVESFSSQAMYVHFPLLLLLNFFFSVVFSLLFKFGYSALMCPYCPHPKQVRLVEFK